MKNKIKRHLHKFLNWIIPNRRKKILVSMMKDAEELGLYDEQFKNKRKMTNKNTYTITLTKEQVRDLVINQLRENSALPPIPNEKFHFQPRMKTIYDTAGDVHDCYREEVYDGLEITYETGDMWSTITVPHINPLPFYGDCSCNPTNGGSGICRCVIANEMVDKNSNTNSNINTSTTTNFNTKDK